MKKLVLTFCILQITFCIVNAQPPPPPGGGGGGTGTDAPIDTNVLALLIISATFGAYKLRRNAGLKDYLHQ